MGDRDLVVIYNPAGGRASALEELRAGLTDRGTEATWHATTEDEPGAGIARTAAAGGAAVVVAAGGDGTIRSCAEGLLGTDVPLGIIPTGTGNVLARDLEIPLNIGEALDVVLSGRVRHIDVAFANGEPFVGMAGMGLAADMIRDSSVQLKKRLGPMAYVATATRNLWRPPFEVTLQLGNRIEREYKATMVLVATAGRALGGISPFPDAEVADGLLRLLVLEAWGLGESLRAFAAVLLGRSHDLVRRDAVRHVTVTTRRPQPYEVNGELRPRVSRLEVSIRPRALRVIVQDSPG